MDPRAATPAGRADRVRIPHRTVMGQRTNRLPAGPATTHRPPPGQADRGPGRTVRHLPWAAGIPAHRDRPRAPDRRIHRQRAPGRGHRPHAPTARHVHRVGQRTDHRRQGRHHPPALQRPGHREIRPPGTGRAPRRANPDRAGTAGHRPAQRAAPRPHRRRPTTRQGEIPTPDHPTPQTRRHGRPLDPLHRPRHRRHRHLRHRPAPPPWARHPEPPTTDAPRKPAPSTPSPTSAHTSWTPAAGTPKPCPPTTAAAPTCTSPSPSTPCNPTTPATTPTTPPPPTRAPPTPAAPTTPPTPAPRRTPPDAAATSPGTAPSAAAKPWPSP